MIPPFLSHLSGRASDFQVKRALKRAVCRSFPFHRNSNFRILHPQSCLSGTDRNTCLFSALLNMAEVIGLAASISTISGLALASARAAKHLLEVAQNAGGISDEIKSVALGLRLSGFSLNEAYRSLKSRDIIDPLSPVYERLRKSGFLADLKQSTKLIKARIKRFPVLVKGLESRIKFVPAFKWLHTHRQEIMSLRQDMESIKTSVSVLVSAAQLELNLIDAKTADPIYLKRLEQDKYVLSGSG